MNAAPARTPRLAGKRVLLVEDNYLVGAALRKALSKLGCQVMGPVASVDEAVRMVQESEVDIGVLDINIVGGTSAPIAESLGRKHRPVLFVTGYGSPKMLPASLHSLRRLNKPVDEHELEDALISLCSPDTESP